MFKHLAFALIAIFWVAMNALLWHSEMGGGAKLASTVPMELVWEKMLTAPDDSVLSLIYQGRKMGHLRWRPNVGEEAATGKIISENEPDGIVRKLTEYTLDIEGNVLVESIKTPIRYSAAITFDRERKWKEFQAEFSLRPTSWDIKSSAEEQDLWFQMRDGETEWIKRIPRQDLRDPIKLLQQFDSPFLPLIMAQGGLPAGAITNSSAPVLHWEARHDWLKFGRNKVRIYRLRARLLDRHEIQVLVTRVGEIIRITLPGDFQLINDSLFAS